MRTTAAAALLCAGLGCVPPLEKSEVESLRESEVVSLSIPELWDLGWERSLPAIRATPLPAVPPGLASPELAEAFRKGAEDGRAWALREGMRSSIVCFFGKSDVDRAHSKGFGAGRDSLEPWRRRIRDESIIVLMSIRRPADLELRGEVPVILCFGRDTPRIHSRAAEESRRAVVASVYARDYAEAGRRADVLSSLLAKALGDARPGRVYLVGLSEGRDALKEIVACGDLPYAWVSPDALSGPAPGETEEAFATRIFRSLP